MGEKTNTAFFTATETSETVNSAFVMNWTSVKITLEPETAMSSSVTIVTHVTVS